MRRFNLSEPGPGVSLTVLVTGGAGFIGSHTAKALAEAGHRPVVYDSLSSGSREAVRWGDLVEGDVRDGAALRTTMERYGVDGVIHFAGLIEVGRSVQRPDLFYDHNVNGGRRSAVGYPGPRGPATGLLLQRGGLWQSADAGRPGRECAEIPDESLRPDKARRRMDDRGARAGLWSLGGRAALLQRGGGGCVGDSGRGPPTGNPPHPAGDRGEPYPGRPLKVFGDDFETPDGSCLRDYIHVSDLARAHVAALEAPMEAGDFLALNVGAGRGHSVFEVIAAVDQACGARTPREIVGRRAGDPASLVADPALTRATFGWTPVESDLDHIVETALRWHRSR